MAGWNGSGNSGEKPFSPQPKPSAKKSPAVVKGIVAGVLLVAIVSVAIIIANTDGTGKRLDDTKQVQMRSAVKASNETSVVHTNVLEKASTKVQRVIGRAPTGEEYIDKTVHTNANGIVTERYQLKDGSWKRINNLNRPDLRVFQSELDLFFAQMGTLPMDRNLPPMPPIKNLEKEFKKAITIPIVVRESDDEKTKAMKRAAIEVRQQVADLMAEGYTVEQILSEHNTLRQKNIEFRGGFQRGLNDVYRKQGREAAEKYMRQANKALEGHGIVPLKLPADNNNRREKSAKER